MNGLSLVTNIVGESCTLSSLTNLAVKSVILSVPVELEVYGVPLIFSVWVSLMTVVAGAGGVGSARIISTRVI